MFLLFECHTTESFHLNETTLTTTFVKRFYFRTQQRSTKTASHPKPIITCSFPAVSMFVKLSWYEKKRLARTKKSRPCKHTRDPELSERLALSVQRSFLSDVCLVVTVCARNKIGETPAANS